MILQQYKIVFAGSMGAGKTSAIQALSDIPVLTTDALNTDIASHQKQLTTVGIDYGEITLDDDVKVGLYGTPGQERFNFMWPVVCQGALGAVVLIDHNHQNALQDLSHYVSTFLQYTQNIAVGITHFNENPQKSIKIYSQWLASQPQVYPLFIIDARQGDDIRLLTESLIANMEANAFHRVE